MIEGTKLDDWRPTRAQCRAAIPYARKAVAEARDVYRESISALVKARAYHAKILAEYRETQAVLDELLAIDEKGQRE